MNLQTDGSVWTVLIKNGSILRFNHLHGFWSPSLFFSLNVFKFLIFWKGLFEFHKTYLLLFFFFVNYFLILFCFLFLLFSPMSGHLPSRGKLLAWLGLEFWWALGLGNLPRENYPSTVFTGGKEGDFLRTREMLGFIDLLYVRNCTILHILNRLNRVK